jgi:hypothetical protein
MANRIAERAGIAAVRACSACAGDYEDPDRLAWTEPDEEEAEGTDAFEETQNEFPVPEK